MSFGRQLDLAVLHILRVDEEDVLEDAEFFQQRGADETVEVAAGDETAGAGDRQGESVGMCPVRTIRRAT